MSEKIVITLKGGAGYDAPWVVIHADNPQEAVDLTSWAKDHGFLSLVAATSKAFLTESNLATSLGAVPVDNPAAAYSAPVPAAAPAYETAVAPGPPPGWAPAAAPAQPAYAAPAAAPGGAPTCPHGTKVFREGTNRNGKPYKMWACPSPKGTPGQCPPEWING